MGELLHRSRAPLFIPGSSGGPVDPTGSALIAWDGSYEASNAVKAAVGLLRLASEVRVLQVREQGKGEMFPSTKLLEYLSRHGIKADLHLDSPGEAKGEAIAGLLLAHAKAMAAAYVVMGGYNHSRMGQYLFGGVTRALLSDCPLPLLIAH
jgi:nucleotide-binding universal stress UspA family protein